MTLIRIPAGRFMMGSPESEKDRLSDEVQHKVTISQPFYFDVTKVTRDEFAAFVADSGYRTDAERKGWSIGFQLTDSEWEPYQVNGASWRNPTFEQEGDHPVVDVSWNDAKAFCDWLSKKSGKIVALPTDAQWEYACRSGKQTTFIWGNNPDDGKGWANCFDQSLAKRLVNPSVIPSFLRGQVRTPFKWDDGFVFTSPVRALKPNGFGLYDMTGNASEWCQDRYLRVDTASMTDPTGWPEEGVPGSPGPGSNRVYRCGSWNDDPSRCHAALRRGAPSDHSDTTMGFRVECLLISQN